MSERGLNRVELIGRLGRDPEVRRTNSGDPIANLRIATTESWKSREGEPQERTEWHTVVIFGPLAKIAEQYLKKGTRVFLAGKLQTRKWQDQSGNDRYSTEVSIGQYGGEMIMLGGSEGGASEGGRDEEGYGRGPAPQTRQKPAPASTLAEDLDDEIPF